MKHTLRSYAYFSAKVAKAVEIYKDLGGHDGPHTVEKILEKIPRQVYDKINYKDLGLLMVSFVRI